MKENGVAYSFDRNGFYIGDYKAQYNPVDGGWLLPAKATWTPPPEAVPGLKLKWDGEKWNYIDIVETLPKNPVLEAAPPERLEVRKDVEILEQLLKNVKEELRHEFSQMISQDEFKKDTVTAFEMIKNEISEISYIASEIKSIRQMVSNSLNQSGDAIRAIDDMAKKVLELNQNKELTVMNETDASGVPLWKKVLSLGLIK